MIRGLASLALVASLAATVAACAGGSLPGPASAAPSQPAASALPAGTYTTSAFQPAVTFTIPDGWEIVGDSANYFQLSPVGAGQVDGIYLFRNPNAASQDPACPDAAEAGVGATSFDLVPWIRSLPGLTVGNPAMATVGGLPGTSIDVRIKEGWTQSCSFANGSPTVPLFSGGSAGYRWVMYGDERMRLYLLDLPSGGTLVINVDTVDGPYIDQIVARALPIIRSMSFATGSGASPAAASPSSAP